MSNIKRIITLILIVITYSLLNVCVSANNEISQINDSYFAAGQQNIFTKIGITSSWEITQGSNDIKIGILERGIDANHEDLTGKINTNLSKDFSNGYWETFSDLTNDGHGTAVAGIISANTKNNIGIARICINTTIISLSIRMDNQPGAIDSIIEAINYAQSEGIDILNMSFSYKASDLSLSEISNFKNAISNYSGLVITGAANSYVDIDEPSNYSYPQCFNLDNIIVVGATDYNDNIWTCFEDTNIYGSNYGKINVDLFAPGANILTTYPSDICDYDCSINNPEHYLYRYHKVNGTSFAAPFVTGVAALIMSKYPSLNAKGVKDTILSNVDKLTNLSDKCISGGRLNAYRALTNPHSHKYNHSYVNKDNNSHYSYCDCGFYMINSHSLVNGKCSLCFATHSHDFNYSLYSSTQHKIYCSCGYESLSSHVIRSSDMGSSIKYCMYCGARINSGFGEIGGLSINSIKISYNGSYILPNGIIILVDEDIIEFENGTLIFYDKCEISDVR